MKKLYFEIQTELDKLDCLRKNWTYYSLKRAEFLKVIATKETEEERDMEFDTQVL